MVKYNNPVVQWAHEHPILFTLFGTSLFFYIPARMLGKTIRIAKYGDPDLGAAPGSPMGEDMSKFTGSGSVSAASYLGALPQASNSPITGKYLFQKVHAHFAEKAEKGEIPKEFVLHYANEKFNQMRASGNYNVVTMSAPQVDQGKNPGDFYRDTAHTWNIHSDGKSVTNPIEAQRSLRDSGAVVAPAVEGKIYRTPTGAAPEYPTANQSVVSILGANSVFAGLSGLDRLR